MEFKEIQKFRQLWIWIPVVLGGLIPVVLFGYAVCLQLFTEKSFGNIAMDDKSLILVFILVFIFELTLFILFASLNLTTCIDRNGIRYRFFPFQLKFRTLAWEEIEHAEVLKYDPIRDYGGWGIRYGKKGKALNVSGKMGLKLDLKNGKHLLLGTKKEQELKDYLRLLNKIS